MKKFTGQSENSSENSIRKGFTVPDGAVNLAWVKSPKLNPKNNIIMIDTSKAISENVNSEQKIQKVAVANSLGILEDLNGNQIWDEEYPIISDVFLNNNQLIYDAASASSLVSLPYVHVSRFFHIDTVGLAFDELSEYLGEDVKVVDLNGKEYKDIEGNKLYKIYLVAPDEINISDGGRSIVYRVYIFLDTNTDDQELYLVYNKGELSKYGVIKNQEINYIELINPRKYFQYLPEETDVIDHYNYHNKVYSSKPALKKEQIIGTATNSSFGWKYFVSKKAIPDPRIFQTFKWRLACEFTEVRSSAARQRNSDPTNPEYPIIKAGVVIPPGGNHLNTRANYLFYQLNITDYNTAGVRFINPLKSLSNSYNPAEQINASYWHVDMSTITPEDLNKFDILLLAPVGEFDISPYLSKINTFTLQGGTFIIETSSKTDVKNIYTDVLVSAPIVNMADSSVINYIQPSTLKFSDATPDDLTDTFIDYLRDQPWPPNITDVVNNFKDTASILKESAVFSGWNLTAAELNRVSAYEGADHVKFQYIESYSGSFVPILEGTKLAEDETEEPKTLMIHQKYLNGGNLFISTACIFEDHLMGDILNSSTSATSISLSSSGQNETIPIQLLNNYNAYCSTVTLSAEMKLRLNIMLYSTLFNPSNQNGSRFSVYDNRLSTIFTEWQSSWVIDGLALLDTEINQYNFILQTASLTDPTPVWKRPLSSLSIKNLIDEKVKQSEDTKHLADLTNRKYYLITTNENVIVPASEEIEENDLPMAWTKVESPKIDDTNDLGSYVIKNEMIQTSSQVSSNNQPDRFPPRPFAFQSSLSSLESKEDSLEKTTIFTLNGEYKIRVETEDEITDEIISTEVIKNWKDSGGQTNKGTKTWQDGWPNPIGIETYTDENYKTKTPVSFPYIGLKGLLYNTQKETVQTIIKAAQGGASRLYTQTNKVYEVLFTDNYTSSSKVPLYKGVPAKSFLGSGTNIGVTSGPQYKDIFDDVQRRADQQRDLDWYYSGKKPLPSNSGSLFTSQNNYSIMTREVLIPAGSQSTIPFPQIKVTEEKVQYTTFSVYDLPYLEEVSTSKEYASKGLNVKRVQMILNELIKDKQLKGPYLKVDGVYGPVTAAKVKSFQTVRKAVWIDGIVDSETWSLLGYSLVGLLDKGWVAPNEDLRKVAETAKSYISLSSVSDGSSDTGYVRQSWVSGGPGSVSETFKINLNITDPIKIHGIVITPWLADSKTDTVEIDYVYVGNDISLKNYKFSDHPSILSNKILAKNNEQTLIDLSSSVREGTCVIVRITQRGKAGWGTSRVLGLKEIGIKTYENVRQVTTVPGQKVEKTGTFQYKTNRRFYTNQTIEVNSYMAFSAGDADDQLTSLPGSGVTIFFDEKGQRIAKPTADIVEFYLKQGLEFDEQSDAFVFDYDFEDELTRKVLYRSIQSGDPSTTQVGGITYIDLGDENTYIVEENKIYRLLPSKKLVITYLGSDLSVVKTAPVNGPRIGNGEYEFYTKKLSSEEVDTAKKTYGYVKASDGVLLICDQNGNPFGFPNVSSLNLSDDNDIQYFSLSLSAFNIDQFTKVGFYDTSPDDPARRGFIYDSYGYSNISYYEYVRRGAQNVYIAVQTGYELDALSNLGSNMVTAARPFSWKMPIYNITLNSSSKVQLNPLPENLTIDDIWYIPVKCGTFTKTIEIPSKQYTSMIGYLNRYQNTKVKAYYNIPESNNATWSSMFGKPYVDIVGEIPEILDDYTIKFKFGNILSIQYPLNNFESKHSSPWVPVFTVYKREDLFSPWKKIPMSQIRDYNLSNGTVILTNRIVSNDNRLLKVDYTCERKEYVFKYDSTHNEYINLNPYININIDWLNKPLYVYIVPQYVYDLNGNIIEESKTNSVVRITNNSYIFNPSDVEYDPTAQMLGIVYVSTSFNIDDLVIIDTRKRGGGVYANYEDKDMEKLQFEYNSYWDVVPSHVTAYQKGGFVIIRLPAELKNDFTTEQIKEVIDRNISAGVAYKIEDLQGNKWES